MLNVRKKAMPYLNSIQVIVYNKLKAKALNLQCQNYRISDSPCVERLSET